MAYTNVWNETVPTGAEAANTIDDIFRSGKVDLRERLSGIFGLSALQWAADPIAPISLTLSGTLSAGSLTLTTAASRIIPGTTSLSLRNTANSVDNILILDNGNVTIRGTLTATGGSILSISGSGSAVSAAALADIPIILGKQYRLTVWDSSDNFVSVVNQIYSLWNVSSLGANTSVGSIVSDPNLSIAQGTGISIRITNGSGVTRYIKYAFELIQ